MRQVCLGIALVLGLTLGGCASVPTSGPPSRQEPTPSPNRTPVPPPTPKAVAVVVTGSARSTPTLAWATPAGVVQGTALSRTQLNATASVAGTFAYLPAAGTLLPPGPWRLSAIFTPANASLYQSVTATVRLVVDAATDLGPNPHPGAALPPPTPPTAIVIQLERVLDGPDTVSFGLPLAPGVAADTSTIRVFIGTDPVAAYIKPLLYDHDQTGAPAGLRAVLVQFPASLMPGPTLSITVTMDQTGPPPPDAVTPFAMVSVDSPETAAVVDRTIVKEGATYRFEESNPRRVTLFTGREPAVLAHFPPGYVALTGILGPLVSAAEVAADADRAGMKFLSDALTPFVRSAYYEEQYALNPAPDSVVDPVENYEGWLYDRCATLLIASAHAGDPAMLRHALRACSYYSSKIILDGPTRGIFSGKPTTDSKYSHARGLYAYYALTGDEGALASLQAIAAMWEAERYFVADYRKGTVRAVGKVWTERLLGTSLEGLFYGFRVTNDKRYLTAFQEMLATAYRHITTTDQAELAAIIKDPNRPPFPPQNCWIHTASQATEGVATHPWCSVWMGELTIESLLAYQKMTADPRVDEIFVRLSRFLRDVGSAYVTTKQSDDVFLEPALPFPGRLDQVRHLVPLYGAALDANLTRARYGTAEDGEHCTDATALTAAALRALVRQGQYDAGGPVGPFPSEGAALLQLHHEFAYCAQSRFDRWFRPSRDPATWTSERIGLGYANPAAFIRAQKIGYATHGASPQRKLSWWFNTSMLQLALLREAGIRIPTLQPGALQPKRKGLSSSKMVVANPAGSLFK